MPLTMRSVAGMKLALSRLELTPMMVLRPRNRRAPLSERVDCQQPGFVAIQQTVEDRFSF